MKKIAITGANGFVGSHLVRQLASEYDVICLVRKGSNLDLLPEGANILRIDYNKLDSISKVLSKCDILIHAAALTRAKNWQTFQKINIDLTQKLLELSGNLQQFIFISSQAVAGPALNKAKPLRETDDCNPISMYGRSKLLAEEIIRNEAEIPFTIIRPVSVFGPGDKDFLQYFKMIKKRIAPQIGFTAKCYNFIYVEDLVELIKRTILNEKAFNEIFFAASSSNYSMSQFIKSIESAMHRKALHPRIPHVVLYPVAAVAEFLNRFSSRPPLINREKIKEFQQKNWIVNPEKAKKLLAFEVKSDLTAQMKETYNWYREKGWL